MTFDDTHTYYQRRAIQALPWDWSWDGDVRQVGDCTYETTFIYLPTDETFKSCYVTDSGKGLWQAWWHSQPEGTRYVNANLCPTMKDYLDRKRVPYRQALASGDVISTYQAVVDFYGDGKARRSGLWFMNHVDEGLWILNQIGASLDAKEAWCLHPIFQGDRDFIAAVDRASKWSSKAVALATEYRSQANAHLSFHPPRVPTAAVRGMHPDVKDMLIADKIQNRKDFEVYLRHQIPNAGRLTAYFGEWFEALGISDAVYEDYKRKIQERTGRLNSLSR